MHQVEIPRSIKDRIVARRGRYVMFDRLDMGRTALLVIDMQNAFVAEGAPVEVPVARAIVPNINRLAAATRAAGGSVVWVITTLAAAGANAWPVYHGHFMTPDRAAAHIAAMTPGNELHAVYPGLETRYEDGDLMVEKNRFSAFIQGASDIERRLRARGIDTLIITGTLSNICCESSARDAMMRGFKVIFAADANAALSDQEHLASLVTVASNFGDVRTTEDIAGLIAASAPAAAAE